MHFSPICSIKLLSLLQLEPQMDACVRKGSWLNLSIPWETEAEELWPCYQHMRPGSYFPGTGAAIFNTSGGNNVLDVDMGDCANIYFIIKTKPAADLGNGSLHNILCSIMTMGIY